MTQEDDGPGDPAAPQGLPLPWDPKHICDTVWYLYSTPGTSYVQLLVATQKAESENEETWEKVRARALVITDLGEGMAELEQWIAKLMAALTQTGQDSSPSSAPGSPWEHGHGWGHSIRSTHNCPNSHSGRGSPGQMTAACNLPTEYGVEGTRSQGGDQGNHSPSVMGRV